MTPYYAGKRATLYLGDSREVLADLPPLAAGLLATDPPYGVRWQGRARNFDVLLGDDGTLDVPAILSEITQRHLRPRRHVYVFGFRPDQLAEPLRLGGTAELIWDKGVAGIGNLALPWSPQHERITFGVRTPSKSNRDAGDGKVAARLRAGSVLRYQRPNSRQVNRHPTEKPVALMRDLIESSTRAGDLVLDPFAGSGSTLVAAVLAGRRAVGVELDERYAAVAADRLARAEQIADLIEAA